MSGFASSACAVGFVIWALHQELPAPPTAPGAIAALLLAMAAYTLATLWMCERWTTLLWRVDPGLPRIESYRSAALGLIGNACLPVRAGDAIRVGMVSTASERLDARSSVGMLVAERALDVGCHAFLLAGICLVRLGPSTGGPFGHLPAVAAGLGLMLAAAAMAIRLGGVALARWRPRGRLWAFLVPVFVPLAGLRWESARVITLSAGIWLAEILAWWAAAQAVGLELNLPQAAYVFAIATLALIAPIGFGAIGTLDAAILLSLDAIEVSATEILGFVLLLRMAFVLPSVFIAVGLGLAQRLSSRAGKVAAGGAREAVNA
ncbi:MAG TPA: lysylphosphatidylglycerol synthase transmembrane domain-containing protein [Solirubrobacterales bacterium]|nr:lysylphosphatidylglycerol synthase transmembrane domain-containing protein [Solirubrobacterales bacterium]